jgi:pilus assembly protein Flp/PilA
MTNLKKLFARVRKDENGATMVEYSILIGIITAAAIGFILGVGEYVTGAWTGLCADLNLDAAIGCAQVGAAP